jgi:exopolyphosphatase/guanosine-5'-triphosphate,3'-diphosphate pyrophosphatase
MKYGIIDFGSNTIRLVIFKYENDMLSKTLNVKRQTQCISYVENHVLTSSGIKACTFALRELILIAKAFDVDELKVFATASLRNIDNSLDARKQIEKNLNIEIDQLSGDEEAEWLCRRSASASISAGVRRRSPISPTGFPSTTFPFLSEVFPCI